MTNPAWEWHRAVAHAREARFWRRVASLAKSRGDAGDVWLCNTFARGYEGRVRDQADEILAELEREGVSRTTPPVPKNFGA